jgi:DNA-directed RNA polymerase subunit RPC12/RpoP
MSSQAQTRTWHAYCGHCDRDLQTERAKTAKQTKYARDYIRCQECGTPQPIHINSGSDHSTTGYCDVIFSSGASVIVRRRDPDE